MKAFGKFSTCAALAALLCGSADLSAAETKLPDSFKIRPDGSFIAEDISFGITHYSDKWVPSMQSKHTVKSDAKNPLITNSSWTLNGKFQFASGKGADITETITALSSESINYSAKISSDEEIPTNELAFKISIGTDKYAGKNISIDGKTIPLPAIFENDKMTIFSSKTVKNISIPVSNGKLSLDGEFQLMIQDDRKFKGESFSIRIKFNPASGAIKESSFSAKISVSPYDSYCLNMTTQANMGFKDDVPADRKGGWTDQGAENDLHMMKPGDYNFGGVKFSIIDPAKNNGKSCIVLAGAERDYFPAELTVQASGKYKYLYLLNALAWAPKEVEPIGNIIIRYKDGSAKDITVKGREEVGNWWEATSAPKGSVVWTGENRSNFVGLYMTKYQIDDKELESITFKSNKRSVWMIPAVSATVENVELPTATPKYIVENNEWKKISFERDIEKNSVMDFSGLLDAPAGKYGFLTQKDGKFVFEKRQDKAVRFYGANLCFTANFLDKEWCEKLADRMAMMGYNSVRLHHFDDGLVLKKDKCSTELNPEKLDQFDYLFHCFKKRGMYVTIDLYISRHLQKGEIPEIPELSGRKDFKGLSFVLDSVMKNWETFSANLMNHVNPYTGMAWKDDPALITISLINEDTIFAAWREGGPELKALYQKKYEEYLKTNNLKATAENHEVLFTKFLIETYNQGYFRMHDFLRKLGVKSMLTDQNMWENTRMLFMRKNYDFVDSHYYWDHPKFITAPWRLPASLLNQSAIKKYASVPGTHFPARILGRGLTITEFDYANPNMFMAEGSTLTGAYASLQDWDGLFRFAYSHDDKSIKGDTYQNFFDVSSDPIRAASEKIGICFFLREDVKKAEKTIPVLVSENYLDSASNPERAPSSIWKIGLIAKTGSVMLDKNYKPEMEFKLKNGKTSPFPANSVALTGTEDAVAALNWNLPFFKGTETGSVIAEMQKAGIIPAECADEAKGIYRSITGEIELNQQDISFKVVTPRSESLIVPVKKNLAGKVLTVEDNSTHAVFFAGAVDDKELASSSRILILHLTDTQNSRIKYSNPEMTVFESWGEVPYLVRVGTAKVSIKGDFKKHKLYAINLAGKRLFEIPLEKTDASVSFQSSILRPEGTVIAYELVKE